ncbi:esterase-like activity of phytase family protein [Afifella marina]|uniref:Esterase-like activity of phytase n=1 Tax=Afifella marina DSM 2698 TaxID=1120955 RepID=A0A1G5NK28_AFIMA|nr:esterase-like activity of phytase family protein [Afifella marina]MBK1623589.1 alkaline phosphatase [Afifella marina DSM 2698]MBK1626582.1 alkaline phosphatase [Afifella marina]MBK5916131.1 alkaline phosphatase [Afifella marina]RAI21666.1 alkaline phosphatase [Afifella marina DSM 2698]SCZ37258.1 Esterase-like activity of phytase [Afifella marina DSM 2698]
MRFFLSTSALALAAAWSLPAAAQQPEAFNRIATFPVAANMPIDRDAASPTVAEIIAATEDGETLVYTDAAQEAVGIIDITDAHAPKPEGFVALAGEPTSVAVTSGKALVAVVTSESYAEPSGELASVDIAAKSVVATCALPGQPDSVALTADATKIAVVIENERDEDLNDGAIPQAPTGLLVTFPVDKGAVDCSGMQEIDLTGISEIAPDDAEPEFVDVNEAGEAVVTLQENNAIAIVEMATGEVTGGFSAGSVDIDGIDTEKDGRISPTGSLKAVKREPDGVQWLDEDRFVTANEGDYEGGSRGFTIFEKGGSVLWDSGNALEHLAMRIGHCPEKRSAKKGTEPEAIEVATFGNDRLIFVGTERSSFVAVYRDTGAAPQFLQVLPSGIGPEGLLAIPARKLLVTANEEDLVEDGGARATVMIYEQGGEAASYPMIEAAEDVGGWGALSGLTADLSVAGKLHGVSDSFYKEAKIFTIDATATPARITSAITVTKDGKPVEDLDLEGIAARRDGGFWLASEGNPEKGKSNRLLRISAEGEVEDDLVLPEEVASKASRFGLEGVTAIGNGDDETVWLAVQRPWGDDGDGLVKLLSYKPASDTWGVVRYPLEKAENGWVGLSEVTAAGEGRLLVIERDNQIGEAARIKRLYAVSLDGVTPAAPGDDAPIVEKTLVRDLLGDLKSTHGYVVDKVEGFAVDKDGAAYIVTDNDGVDDSNGETLFLRFEGADLAD